MNYRKITLSASVIAFVSALVFGGTQAFFSDEEVSTGNTFSAGAIDLQIDNTSYGFDWNREGENDPTGEWGENPDNTWGLDDLTDQLFFSFIDLKPGDYGEDTISIHVDDNDAWACMAFNLTDTLENDLVDPEEDAGDTTEDEGELQNYLSFIFWWDDGDNVLESDEVVIEELSGLSSEMFDGNWLAIADTENEEDPLEGGSTHFIGKGWCFGDITEDPVDQDDANNIPPDAPDRIGFTCDGTGDHNDAQTDGIEVDVAFNAVQSRNNDDFVCADLPPLEEEEERPLVGAALASFTQSDQCDVTVGVEDGYATIQAAIDDVDADTVICVDDGTYEEDVLVNKDGITLSGSGSDNSSTIQGQGTGEPGALVIAADNVVVEGFHVIGTGVSAIRISGAHDNVTIDSNRAVAADGHNALLMDGGQTNHMVTNNVFETEGGDEASQLVYVVGDTSTALGSDNVDFMGNTFAGTIIDGGVAYGTESTNANVTRNVFEDTLTSSYAVTEFWKEDALVNENNFHDTTSVLVRNSEDTSPLNAENNWWGEASPTNHTEGDVDDDPMEASPFSEN